MAPSTAGAHVGAGALTVSVRLSSYVVENSSEFDAWASAPNASASAVFSWSLNSTYPIPGTASQTSIGAPSVPATYRVNVTVTDGASRAFAETSVVVWDRSSTGASPPTLSAAVKAIPSSPEAGSPVLVQAEGQGGLPPYSYTWTLNGSPMARPVSSWALTAHGGTYAFGVQVTDSAGRSQSASFSLTVPPPPSPPVRAASLNTPNWMLVLALALVGLAVAAGLFAGRSMSRREASAARRAAVPPRIAPKRGPERQAPAPPPSRPRRERGAPARSAPTLPSPRGAGTVATRTAGARPPRQVVPSTVTPGQPRRPGGMRTLPRTTPNPSLSSPAGSEAAPDSKITLKEPPWPMTPLTVVECTDRARFWRMASASGLEREKMLVFTPDSPGAITAKYGITGATVYRVTRSEGEGNVAPGDVDRIGYLIESHFAKGSGRAVILDGVSPLIDATNIRSVRRLIEVTLEAAEATSGAALVNVNPELVGQVERRQIEEKAIIRRLKA